MPVVIGALSGTLLEFAPGHPEDLQAAFAGADFIGCLGVPLLLDDWYHFV